MISNSWNKTEGESISQKVMGKVKPDEPLKNRIDFAQKKLQSQITKLSGINEKLQVKHDKIFEKCVNAQRNNKPVYAQAYAGELAQVRKMKNMVSGAKLSMEQVKLRLDTVSELGDVVDAIPQSIYDADDLMLYVSSDVMRAYRRSLGGFAANGMGGNGFDGKGNNQDINVEFFDRVKLFQANGLPAKTIIAAQKSNLAFGTGLMSDHNEVRVIDLADIDGSNNFRLVLRFTAGVQVGIPGDVVYYGA